MAYRKIFVSAWLCLYSSNVFSGEVQNPNPNYKFGAGAYLAGSNMGFGTVYGPQIEIAYPQWVLGADLRFGEQHEVFTFDVGDESKVSNVAISLGKLQQYEHTDLEIGVQFGVLFQELKRSEIESTCVENCDNVFDVLFLNAVYANDTIVTIKHNLSPILGGYIKWTLLPKFMFNPYLSMGLGLGSGTQLGAGLKVNFNPTSNE